MKLKDWLIENLLKFFLFYLVSVKNNGEKKLFIKWNEIKKKFCYSYLFKMKKRVNLIYYCCVYVFFR